MDFNKIINNISEEVLSEPNEGNMAHYIPLLAQVNPNKYGISLFKLTGENFVYGDYNERFSIQSIAKVFSLTITYNLLGEDLWKRVGVEPSGNSFNSLVQLEYEQGIPRNPFINAGALVVSDVLIEHFGKNAKAEFLNFVQKISLNPNISFNDEIAKSEKATSFRNAAIVNLMKSFGNIKNDVNEVLDFYFNLCSIEMSCLELSRTFLLYASSGLLTQTGERILTISRTKRLNAIMQTCGFYDESGDFSIKVGLPGKSGVGGGIAAIHPGKYAVAVWSPRLNKKGNSVRGMKALELLTTKTQLSIF